MVSDSNDSGVIQKRIVQNLYENEIIICDVSGKNPNVMFELGMRLAFDKPAVVIKDDQTSYSFDTSPIEHLSYPRDLRHGQIEEFKKKLAEKVTNTFNSFSDDPNYTTFLGHFGSYKVASVPSETLAEQGYLIKAIDEIKSDLSTIKTSSNNPGVMLNNMLEQVSVNTICAKGSAEELNEFNEALLNTKLFTSIGQRHINKGHWHLNTTPSPKENEDKIREVAKETGVRINWIG